MNLTHYLVAALYCSSLVAQAQELSLQEVPAAQRYIWNSWQQQVKCSTSAFSIFQQATLPSLRQPTTQSQLLPSQLEEHAELQFYVGTKGEQPKSGYPLFLYLHGSGQAEQEWTTGLSLSQGFDDAPSTYVVPKMPNPTGEWYRWYQQSKQWAWEEMLQQAMASPNIDPNRIYVFGISEGGYGSQRLASYYADYWAGAGPMAGGEPLRNAPAENCQHIAFSLLTGSQDYGFGRNQITMVAKEVFDQLEQQYPNTFKHRIELQQGRGHGINYNPTTSWLKEYRRNPRPQEFLWENFPMGGRYRSGFYNLRVDESPKLPEVAATSPGATNDYDGRSNRYFHHLSMANNEVRLTVKEVTYTVTENVPGTSIPMKFNRTYSPAKSGTYTIFLDNTLVNLAQPVKVWVNGKKVFEGTVKCDAKNIRESLELFHDPERLFPAAVQVKL
ncbi:hypothetical protein [Alloprevotella sp. oral taxon 473]|uniref:hypothetical protein n=1 Tax=Alloprevotella sp. oral taxon 473 TaxID=712469 RepID=UPI0002A45D3E|nr:hypothetical protein [Alloprevotella sp. oral taxon 473]EKX94335.1 hypothetical protein HMPREF9999_00127 [Alloprevotella sp. oral taxon 473 str. F0040]